jgi:hypothetical protein
MRKNRMVFGLERLQRLLYSRTRNNDLMAIVRTGVVNQTKLANEVNKAVRKLGKDVVRVRYNVGTDWSGDPAIYFRIVLSDAASREDRLGDVAGRIRTILFEEIRPYENWGLIPYFNFRSKSEQAKRNEPEWA